MTTYKNIAESSNCTVVAEYNSETASQTQHQSEYQLEQEFLSLLQANGFQYLPINNNEDLVRNLRCQLESLNRIKFSESEWKRIFNEYISNQNESIAEKTFKIQENYIYVLNRDNGTKKNVCIIDKKNIHNNSVQVINQYEAAGTQKNRYDVTILVNGLPMVHVELKRRGVSLKEAFNQINRYQRDSFWADSGLFEYAQLFVISNGTLTKYYSNTTRDSHVKEQQESKERKNTSNTFEFTSWWTDAKNKRIADLVDFSKTFFSKHTLLSVLIRYCVFTSERLLLVMRPYQIAAAERIFTKIKMSNSHRKYGTVEAGGYIWHATGSGKTLTSFKTAQLAKELQEIDKVLFVVDRKDLDYQTMKEYDKFQKGAANSNTSTAILKKQLEDHRSDIIITTIQKLSRFVASNRGHDVFRKHVVLIFDECHRSQFGEMHSAITNAFKRYYLYGFTGTPILSNNSPAGGNPRLKTTEQAFGEKLHAYTIVDAIRDQNVLPFKIDYISTIPIPDESRSHQFSSVCREAMFNAPDRITKVTDYILKQFDTKTYRKQGQGSYSFNKLSNIAEVASDKERDLTKQVKEIRQKTQFDGFNSIFAVSSIDMAMKYYAEIQSRTPMLKVATVYSFSTNEEDISNGLLQDESFDTGEMDQSSRDFLEKAIQDYNSYFGTSYDTSTDKFENYYRDVSQRVKNRELDLLIVVNMFLTGFDATTLNTLWVDKNLRFHGLIQAFSRTNRILNAVKKFGNIVCFRNLERATNDALTMFGDNDAKSIVLLRSFKDYYEGWEEGGEVHRGYKQVVSELQVRFSDPINLTGEEEEKDFIKLWSEELRLRNILSSFDEFEQYGLLDERQIQDFQSVYLNLYEKNRNPSSGIRDISVEGIEFEIELVKQITVNIDYILQLVREYRRSLSDKKEKSDDIRGRIHRSVNSSIDLRNKKKLFDDFIDQLTDRSSKDIDLAWREFVEKSQETELEQIIEDEDLKPEKARKFIANAFRDSEMRSTGTEFANILPPVSMFDELNSHSLTKERVYNRLIEHFERYRGT